MKKGILFIMNAAEDTMDVQENENMTSLTKSGI